MRIPGEKNQDKWLMFSSYYVLLLPLWFLLAFLFDAASINHYAFYGFMRLGFFMVFVIIIMIINPLVAGLLTIKKLREITGQDLIKPIVSIWLIVYSFSLLVLFSPNLISLIHSTIYDSRDKETITKILEESKKNKTFNIKEIRHSKQRDFWESNWLDLIIYFEIEKPQGYYIDDIKEYLKGFNFHRDTIIKVWVTTSLDISQKEDASGYYIYFFYDAHTKELNG